MNRALSASKNYQIVNIFDEGTRLGLFDFNTHTIPLKLSVFLY